MVNFHVITLFPESLDSYINASILKRAQEKKLVSVRFYNPRDFAGGTSYADRRVDDKPYGGGPGMVIEALPVIRAIAAAIKKAKKGNSKIIFFNPSGKVFSNKVAESFKKYSDIILICGRYEGIDARIKKVFPMVEISVGDYVLTGGEVPAMIVIDAITRRIPGVLGDGLSIEEERVAGKDVYTRPPVLIYKKKKYSVPKILLSGHHKKIDEWKMKGRGKK